MAENGTIAYLSKMPDCDFPHESIKPVQAEYDFRTKAGYWAYGCEDHWLMHRASVALGVGRGQRLELPPPGMDDAPDESEVEVHPEHVPGEVPANEHDSSDLV